MSDGVDSLALLTAKISKRSLRSDGEQDGGSGGRSALPKSVMIARQCRFQLAHERRWCSLPSHVHSMAIGSLHKWK